MPLTAVHRRERVKIRGENCCITKDSDPHNLYEQGREAFLTMMKYLLLSVSLLPASAMAQVGVVDPISVSGGVSIVSDYHSRGISLSNNKVAVQPSLNLTHESGAYIGAWGSTTANTPRNGHVEVELYGGYATEIASGTNLDVGLHYYVPSGPSDLGHSDMFEVQSAISHTLGPVEVVGRLAYSWDQKSLGQDNIYASMSVNGGIPQTPITLISRIGYQDGALARLAPKDRYWEWTLGATAALGPVTAGVRYADTDIPKSGVKAVDKLYSPRLIFSLATYF